MNGTEKYLLNALLTIKDTHGCDLLALKESDIVSEDEFFMLSPGCICESCLAKKAIQHVRELREDIDSTLKELE